MSYNIICESTEKINWKELNAYVSKMMLLEVLPMPNMGIDGGDAIGICVPLAKTGEKAWRETESLLTSLLQDPSLCIYEMYSGKRITLNNLHELKLQLVC